MKHLLRIVLVTVICLLFVCWNSWGADTMTEKLEVVSESTPAEWEAYNADNTVDAVDTDDDDTEYLKTIIQISLHDKHRFNLADISTIEAVDSVTVTFRCKTNSAGGRANIFVSGDSTLGTSRSVASFTTYTETLAKPGGGGWAVADVNSMQIEVEVASMSIGAYIYCPRLYVTVYGCYAETFQGTTETDDVKLSSSNPDKNYGIQGDLYFHSTYARTLFRCNDIRSTLGSGKTIHCCSLYVYLSSTSSSDNLSAYRVFKGWVEGDEDGVDNDDGDATWNDWQSDAYEWASGGCGSADDEGEDNSGDGTGADRKATAEYTYTIDHPDDQNTYVAFDLTSICQDWYDETISNNGVIILTDAASNTIAEASESETQKPYFTVKYLTNNQGNGSEYENVRRRKIISNQSQGE